MSDKQFTYYVAKASDGLYELRQTRFIGKSHPHDLCAVARTPEEMANMIKFFKGSSIDWRGHEPPGVT